MSDHFVIIGAQRCGTSYLSTLLDEHPEIEMAKPARPEPKFFLDSDKFAQGLDYYESQYFSDPAARMRGEKSTSYIESDVAAGRINAMFPQARMVVVLRDPVHRAISNYNFTVGHGHEDLPPTVALRDATSSTRSWDHERFSVSPYAYLDRGRYVEYLERLTRRIDRARLDVLVLEELVADAGVIAGLYERLGVDPTFRPCSLLEIVNASDPPGEPIEPELEVWLREYFREPNRRLEQFLGRPLPWAEPPVP